MTAGYLDTFSWSLPGLSWVTVVLLLIGISKMLTFFIWPSIRNLPFIMSVPFVGIAVGWGAYYWTPRFIANNSLSATTVETFAIILTAGAMVTCIAAVATLRTATTPRGLAVFRRLMVDKADHTVELGLFIGAFVFLLGAVVAIGGFYALSGVIPAFAANPLVAKYFAGEYTARAAPYMILFRGGMALYEVGTVVAILLLAARLSIARIVLFLLLVCAVVLAILSLRRGEVAQPVVEGLLILLVVRGRWGWVCFGVALYLLAFSAGAAVNQVLFYALGLTDKVGFDAIIKGLSDVSDLWWFLEAYHKADAPSSMGMTVFGGLVPYDFPWNPGNYTKMIVGADLNTGSGGFRLPMSLWGYDAFGYPGMALWAAVEGFAITIQVMTFRLMAETKGSRAVLALNFVTYRLVLGASNNLLQWQIDSVLTMILYLMLRLLPIWLLMLGRRYGEERTLRGGLRA